MEEAANFIITILATLEIKNVYASINISDIMSVKIPMLPYVLQCYGSVATHQPICHAADTRSRKETFMATNRLRQTTFQHLYCFFGFVSPHNGWTQYHISSTFFASNLFNMALHGCIIPFDVISTDILFNHVHDDQTAYRIEKKQLEIKVLISL